MRFTFCTFTYNQRQLVLRQLESIKYQIEHFGKNIECYYLLADDHSDDGTPEVVASWLECNQGLFKETKIVVSDINKGVVANYTNALKNIETEYFKITAGDDYYFKNNIFDVYGDSNLVLSPLIFADENDNIVSIKERFLKKVARFGDDSERIKKFVVSQYKYGGGIYAPGVFMKKELIGEGLYEALKPFKWIEDAPEWFYLMKQDKTKVRIEARPLVVYRVGTGTSQNKSKEYLEDLELIRKTIYKKGKPGSKFKNPYFYIKIVDREISTLPALLKKEGRMKISELKINSDKDRKSAKEYNDMIIQRADDYYKTLSER